MRSETTGEPAGSFYTWWRGDDLPDLPRLSGFAARAITNVDILAALTGLTPVQVTRRLETGNTAYVAYIGTEAVGYGWSASGTAAIDDLLLFTVPPDERYLWDFATLPDWRGRGIYPHLLQFALVEEQSRAARFWIGHEEHNQASARGILNAGFERVGRVRYLSEGSLGLLPDQNVERAQRAAALLGVPLLTGNEPVR